MLGINKWKSIRWKFILIYFLLVFIAMTMVGIFIMKQLRAYQMDVVSDNTKRINDEIMRSLSDYDDLNGKQEEIQSNIEQWYKSVQEDIYVINDTGVIIASTSSNLINKSAVDYLDLNLVISSIHGQSQEKDSVITSQQPSMPVKNMAFPIKKNNKTIGALYLRADLSNVYATMKKAKIIFIQAMGLALLVTIILGFLIARSITVPINDVTEKAKKMATGDFSEGVNIKSDDEIGRLADMFNLLREKLDVTLSEMSNDKNKLETILKNMADGLIAVDLGGPIIHANLAAKQMLRLSDDEIETLHYDDIIQKYSKNLTFRAIKEKSNNWEGNENFEYFGSIFFARYALFKDENDNNKGIVMIIQDITERQKLENMQRDFVANVSHELKTPLTTIKSYTETLLDGAVSDIETATSFLAVVDTEADRMSRLVKELLQLSRLDYNIEKWDKRANNLTAILKAAVVKIEINAVNKKQHLNCLFDSKKKIPVFADKDRLEQVVLNILSNAIKYTQQKGRIDIDAGMRGQEAYITIKDNGMGIPENEIPRLFERFYRVDKARSRAMGGTGLGLSIAKQIIEEHDGRISIESKEGKGTTVIIVIPAFNGQTEALAEV